MTHKKGGIQSFKIKMDGQNRLFTFMNREQLDSTKKKKQSLNHQQFNGNNNDSLVGIIEESRKKREAFIKNLLKVNTSVVKMKPYRTPKGSLSPGNHQRFYSNFVRDKSAVSYRNPNCHDNTVIETARTVNKGDKKISRINSLIEVEKVKKEQKMSARDSKKRSLVEVKENKENLKIGDLVKKRKILQKELKQLNKEIHHKKKKKKPTKIQSKKESIVDRFS